MKKFVKWAVVGTMVILILAAGCAQITPTSTTGSNLKPSLVVTPSVVPLDKDTQIVILGSDFQPGEPINLMITDKMGNRSGISNVCDPEPVASGMGTWATTFTLGRFASRGMITAGTHKIWVIDSNAATIASAPVAFYESE